MPTTLVAVSGMSPAIITETVWALAQESPAVVPDEVVIITTSKGGTDIQRDLLSPQDTWTGKTVWETLRRDIFKITKLPAKSPKLQLSIRVITLPDTETGLRQPAADLRTREHNQEAADFIIQTLAPLCDATDQRVIASIAGGRKTMGALLYAAMSLLGKETDRVTHVLVNEPFDAVRGFYYPAQPHREIHARLHGREPFPILAKDARIELADIPFVPLRNKFAELNERRTFQGLVETYSKAARHTAALPPKVEIKEHEGVLTVEGRPIKLTGRDLLVAAFLLEHACAGKPHFKDKDDAKEAIIRFNKRWQNRHPFHQATTRLSANGIDADDIPKALSSLRKKLTAAGLEIYIPHLAPERSRIGFQISVPPV